MPGLAVHWEDEIVFWSDMNLGHIMYSQLDGRYHAFLLTGLVKPKALAVDPVEGYGYFSRACCDICLKETRSERRSFAGELPVLRSTCSQWGKVTTYVGKPSAIGQPTKPTQPFISSGSISE